MTAKFFNPKDYNFSSQSLPTLISSDKPTKLTYAFYMPTAEVYKDMWMQNQLTPSYYARAAVSGLLVAYGYLQNDVITLAAAFLFTPFLAQDLAVGFGLITREWRLAMQGGACSSYQYGHLHTSQSCGRLTDGRTAAI